MPPLKKEEPRQWQWVFRALWSAAPRLSSNTHEQVESASATRTLSLSPRRTSCHLRLLVPDTILFERGEPCKWVGCSPEGIVVRKPFLREPTRRRYDEAHSFSTAVDDGAREGAFEPRHAPLTTRLATHTQMRTLDDFEIAERLDIVVDAFLSFAASSAGSTPSSVPSSSESEKESDMPICVARYNDGTAEHLSASSLKTLCKSYNWRTSLCALQAYVHPSRETTPTKMIGTFTRKGDRNEISPDLRHPERTRVTHDGSKLSPGSTNCDHQKVGDEFERPTYGSHVTSKAQSPGEQLAVGTGDTPVTISTTILDLATRDLAFVADMSYTSLGESSGTTPRSAPCTIAMAKSRSQDRGETYDLKSKIETKCGGESVDTCTVLVGGQTLNHRNHRPPWASSRVRISRLEAEFVIDRSGCPWLTNAPKVLVSAKGTPRKDADEESQRSIQKRMKQEAFVACSDAARELRAVITLAHRRGLNAEEIFQHFVADDVADSNVGGELAVSRRAGKSEVVKGMQRLGISLSEDAALMLIRMIVRSRARAHPPLLRRPASDSSHSGNWKGQPRRKRKGGGNAAVIDGGGKPASKRTICSSLKSSAERKSSSLAREHICAEDLINFATRVESKAHKSATVTSLQDEKGVGSASESDGFLPSQSEEGFEEDVASLRHRNIEEETRPSFKRRRTKDIWCSQEGGGVKHKFMEDALREEGAGTGRAERPKPAVASISGFGNHRRSIPTLSRSFAGGNAEAIVGADAGDGSPPREPTRSTKAAGQNAPRPHSTPSYTAPRATGRKIDFRGARGTLLGLRSASTFPCRSQPTLPERNSVPWAVQQGAPSGIAGLMSFPCENPAAEALDGKDRVFYVDRGLVIAYRVLGHQKNLAESSHRCRTTDAVGSGIDEMPATCSGNDAATNNTSCWGPSLMVVVPGLFQTLDTLEKALLPLLEAHTDLTILLVAPPGLPNTHWPAALSLDGELTAMCVANLLEHLLESEEIVSRHVNNDGGDNLPSTRPSTSYGHPLTATTATLNANLNKADGKQAATCSHPQKREAPYRPPSPSVYPTGRRSGVAFLDRASPVIFVGFGTGANSLLHLAAGPLLTTPLGFPNDEVGGRKGYGPGNEGGGDVVGDGGKNLPDGSGGMGNEQEEGSGIVGGAKARRGFLASTLRNKGFRVGGLVVANGFVSLNEQSKQVLRTFRQAFCDLSDGSARAEAVTSLLLSENDASTGIDQSVATTTTTTTTSFLETREALCLDADVPAHVHPLRCGASPPRAAAPVPGGSYGRIEQLKYSGSLSGCIEQDHSKVSVDSVLREVEESNAKQKRQLLRRQRQRWPRTNQTRYSRLRRQPQLDGSSYSIDDDDDYHGEKRPHEDQENSTDEGGSDEDNHIRWSPQEGERRGGSTLDNNEEQGNANANVSFSRRALAASVSILSGLLASNPEDRGFDVDKVRTSPSGVVGDGGPTANHGMVGAIKCAGVPLLMVQSTEDALIGSPLSFVVKQELLPEELAEAEVGGVLECFISPPQSSRSSSEAPPRNTAQAKESASPSSSSSSSEGTGRGEGDQAFRSGGATRDGKARSLDEEEQKWGKARSRNSFVMHTCWVKSGHDVLHERKPFLLSLLHKVIHACRGGEAPQTPFPHETVVRQADDTDDNAPGGCGRGKDESRRTVSPFSHIGEVGWGSTKKVEGDQMRWVEDDDSKSGNSEAAKMVFSHDATVSNGGRATTPGASFVFDACAGIGRAEDSMGVLPRESELKNSTLWMHPSCLTCDIGSKDGSFDIGRGVTALERAYPSPGGPSATDTCSSTAGSSSISSVATSISMGCAPKLIDFFNLDDEDSNAQFRAAREYLAEFRDFNLDRAILENGLGATGERLMALNLPLVARYTFQIMKDCWRCRMLTVEAVRLDLGMRQKQAVAREQLALSIRAVSNMTRTLRRNNSRGTNASNGNSEESVTSTLLHLDPPDQRILKAEIEAAEVARGIQYTNCRRLRRSGAVLRARRERLEANLAHLTEGARGTLLSLERIMGQLRKQLALARIQERVFREEVAKADREGLRSRRRLTVIKDQLTMLQLHPQKWTDSDTWQPGYIQRLETAELIKILGAEARHLQSAAEIAAEQSERAKVLHSGISQQESQFTLMMEGVGALFSLLSTALEDDGFVKHPEVTVEEQIALENDVIGFVDDKGANERLWRRKKRGGRGKQQSVAARVRFTSHRNRSQAEKKWVALDAVLNPRLYHHVTLSEAEEMRWDPSYYTKLGREDILRVLSLPAQIHLALPFLHTPDEVAAHELLSRYTLGINADHFARLDKNSQDEGPRTITASSAVSSSASSGRGRSAGMSAIGSRGNRNARGTSAKAHQRRNGWDEDDAPGVTRRVLACMRRAVEAYLKSPAEEDLEEACWCVLDRKLRRGFYCDSDEAAADRNEELHVEADAREDARHPWLKAPGAANARNTAREGEAFPDESRRSMMIDDVVEQQNESNEKVASGKSTVDRDVIAISESFSPDDIKALALGASEEQIWGDKERPDLATTVTVGKEREDQEQSNRLVDIVKRVLVRFFVSEEETPIGRDMAWSLAMLQEAALRLGRGQRHVLTGLNRHSAFALLSSRPSLSKRSSSAENSTVPADSANIVTKAEEEEAEVKLGMGMGVGGGEGAGGGGGRLKLGEAGAAEGNGSVGEAATVNAMSGDKCSTSLNAETTCHADSVGSVGAKRVLAGSVNSTLESESLGDSRSNFDGGSMTSIGDGSTESITPRKLDKVYGSWEEVHPAALGIASQDDHFSPGKGERVHPASFRRSAREGVPKSMPASPLTTAGTTSDLTNGRPNHYCGQNWSADLDPLDILTAESRAGFRPVWLSGDGDGDCKLVVSGMDKVAELDRGEVNRRGLLVVSRRRACLLDVGTSELQGGQSKAYAFQVGACDTGSNSNTDSGVGNEGGIGVTCSMGGSSVDVRNSGAEKLDHRGGDMSSGVHAAENASAVVGIAVTVVYQGHFEVEGYRLGRLAAGLFRMPPTFGEDTGEMELPQPVGFAPHSLQSLNTPDSIGRIMIFHQPRVKPVRAGRFQLVLGAVSRVRYSVSVVALTATDALTAFDESVAEARHMQNKLPSLVKKMDAFKDTRRLSRWKLRIIKELLEEAQDEAVRCDGEVKEVKREIQEEEKDQLMENEGRLALLAEARDLGAELARWKGVFSSRVQERKDVRAGLERIQERLKAMQDEANGLRKKLAKARKVLPAAAFVLKSQREAIDIALALNASVDNFSGAAARWAASDLLQDRRDIMLSPADRVRRALKDGGWDVLSMDEKRFTMLDRVLRPDLYVWMKDSYLDMEGVPVLAPEVPNTSEKRKDSLVELIGPGPIGSKILDNVETIEGALEARRVQGFSKKARSFATPSVWTKKEKENSRAGGSGGSTAGPGAGALTARSEVTSKEALNSRSGTAAASRPTLVNQWRLADFSFTRMEVERIKTTSFNRLQRKEMTARKILGRFHEHSMHDKQNEESTEQLLRAAETRCAAVRAKDKATRTKDESEWVEIDKVLFPDVWRQKNRHEDRLRRFNMTLAGFNEPPAEDSRDSDDSDEGEDDGDSDDVHGDGASLTSREAEERGGTGNGRAGHNPGGRKKNWTLMECPFDREEILQIWASAKQGETSAPQQQLRSRGEDHMLDRQDDVRRVQELLLAFNGPYSAFSRDRDRWEKKKMLDASPLTMTSSKRIATFVADRNRAAAEYAQGSARLGRPAGTARGPGSDAKIIALMHEFMAAKSIHSKYMDTKVAHNVAQRFNTEHYAGELQRDIEAQLREQIQERERAKDKQKTTTPVGEECVIESSDDEDENWETNEAPGKIMSVGTGSCAQTADAAPTLPREEKRGFNVATGPHVNGSLPGQNMSSSAGGRNEPGSSVLDIAAEKPSAPKHGGVTGGNMTGDFGGAGESAQVEQKINSNWQDQPVVQEFTPDEVQELIDDNPAWEGCRACLTLPCRWCSCVDYRSVGARKTQIMGELKRLMELWDEDEVVTAVPLSCVRGGPTTLPRTEAVGELRWEAKELDRQLHLAAVDKELHDAYDSTREAIEVKSLHEYSTLMWTKDAQGALSKERELTLARSIAHEVVDDLLESMLDGWVFGERQGEHAASGFIPAVKASGPLRPGDQRRAVAYLEHRHRLRRMAHAKGERLPQEIKGTHHTKALPIDDIAQRRILDGRAKKKEEDTKHLLRETETTMKFGLFCMLQGYLHSMTLVQREKEAWSGKGDVITRGDDHSIRRPPLTSERKEMVKEMVKARERQAARRKFLDRARRAEDRRELRIAQSKRRVSQRKVMRVRELIEKGKAARDIQTIFRGFRGKIFAERWALKRAEVEALKSVLHEAAVNVQRAYRGHLGRVEASEVRMELAEYIADIRVKEAEIDIADFWETHKFRAAKDELKRKLRNTIGRPLIMMHKKKLE